jgi:TPP-dependent pyruvate/acetoin dehydrogenase alpha subunit
MDLQSAIDPAKKKQMYEMMVLIRKFEEKLVELSQIQGRAPGMQILANGQEAVAVGVAHALTIDDVIVSNHRSHGHLLARGADPRQLMAEIMGKKTGTAKGKSGTLHMAVPEVNAFMTSTVVGAGPPMAVGAAFAQQYGNDPGMTVVFYGDGAAAEGSVHEAMNLAALWKLPVLFVCENNCWAGAQSLQQHCSIGDIAERGKAYGMPGEFVDGNDVEDVYHYAHTLAARCRNGEGPALMEARTYRMRGHGEYDHQHYVDREELHKWAELCPIKRYRERLIRHGTAKPGELEEMEQKAETLILEALAYADKSPYPSPEEALEDVWADLQGGYITGS